MLQPRVVFLLLALSIGLVSESAAAAESNLQTTNSLLTGLTDTPLLVGDVCWTKAEVVFLFTCRREAA